MKKFKTQKEILINPEFKVLAFELLRDELILREEDSFFTKEEEIENKIERFINIKLQRCFMEGV